MDGWIYLISDACKLKPEIRPTIKILRKAVPLKPIPSRFMTVCCFLGCRVIAAYVQMSGPQDAERSNVVSC